jgi:hypothetical protein
MVSRLASEAIVEHLEVVDIGQQQGTMLSGIAPRPHEDTLQAIEK